jgi:hypothetical protein
MPSQDDYPDDAVQACFAVLLELFTYLKPYRDHIVLIGGWVPFLLTEGRAEEPHIGSLDIDLALDANRIPDTGYVTILSLLEERGYRPSLNRNGNVIPSRYEKRIPLADGQIYPVQVDFLAPEYGGTGGQHRHQRVQELLAHKARGSDLVFTHFIEREIIGRLPNRAENRERIKIANPAACLVMKSIAFGERSSEKDAYDLYMLCDTLGVQTMVEQLVPLKENKLLREAIVILREKFHSPNTLGPSSIAEFVRATGDDAERIKRRAFELFQAIISTLGPL